MNFNDYKKKVVADNRMGQDEIDAMEVVAKLITIRKEKNMTQGELAEKIGMQQNQISRFENLKVTPTLETVIKIAKGLNSKVEFISDDEHEESEREAVGSR